MLLAFAHKKFTGSKLSKWVSIACLTALLLDLAPERAKNGPPFHTFKQSRVAFISCSFQTRSLNETFTNYCTDPTTLGTMAHCYSLAYPSYIPLFLQLCSDDYGINITQNQFDAAHDHYLDSDSPRLDDGNVWLYKDSFDQFLGNYNRSITYGLYMVLFWVVVLGFVALVNWVSYIGRLQHNSRGVNFLRRFLTLPAAFGRYKTNHYPLWRYFDFLSPTRFEVAVLGVFFAALVFFCTHNIHAVENDPIFLLPKRALFRYYAVRTSCISSALMPFLILFGGRNNFLQWVTMWDYSTFIMFHRWISRAIMVMICVHVFFYSFLITNKYQTYLYAGEAAFMGGIVIMVQGMLFLRRSNYELFLLLHIALALVFIIGAYVHVESIYCEWFYYTSGAIWLFDRLVRIARLITFGVQTSTVQLFPGDLTLKVSVPKPKGWDSAVAGGHSFIHFLHWDCFWQSHPFTYTVVNDEIHLFIKVKEGVTYKMYKHLLGSPDKKLRVKVAVEGSYGEKTLASLYAHSVFVAGGNGIPGIYAEAIELLENNENQMITLIWVVRDRSSLEWFKDELELLNGTKITTIVYVTSEKPGTIVSNGPITSDKIERVPESATNVSSLDETTRIANLSTSYGTFSSDTISTPIEYRQGRPKMDALVQEMIEILTGGTCFVTCGNPIMVDELRHEVVQQVGISKHRVQYYEQLQVWA